MKKNVLLLLLGILLFSPIMVNAKVYEIASEELTLELSDRWQVLTRDNLKGNKAIEGLDEDVVKETFINNDIFMEAFVDIESTEIFLLQKKNDGYNYNLADLSKSKLKDVAETWQNEINAEDYTIHKNNGMVFIKYNYFSIEDNYHIYDCYTIVNGNIYVLKLQSQKALNNSDITDFEKAIDSMKIEINDDGRLEQAADLILGSVIIYIVAVGAYLVFAITTCVITYVVVKNSKKKKNRI